MHRCFRHRNIAFIKKLMRAATENMMIFGSLWLKMKHYVNWQIKYFKWGWQKGCADPISCTDFQKNSRITHMNKKGKPKICLPLEDFTGGIYLRRQWSRLTLVNKFTNHARLSLKWLHIDFGLNHATRVNHLPPS